MGSKRANNPTKRVCGLCGRDPAAGFASINDVWYCHGDDDVTPTCYERSQGRYLDPVHFHVEGAATLYKDGVLVLYDQESAHS